MTHSVEILAPAGNPEMLHAAVLAGANAVYLGLEQFNARRSAGNFTTDALGQAVVFCHARKVRVHVALNTVLYPAELPDMARAVHAVAQAGVDAVIVQDLAVARLVRVMAPGLALHASTQMSVHSLAGAQQLADMGFSRVIVSRELSLAEIAHITARCGIETEVFVHGALCMSVSGQCYMSAFLGGRSGNRGACAGPCRLPFDAGAPCAAQGENTGVAAVNGTHHLSLKDMSHIAMLPQLAQAGVASVKIEGRLRSPEYAAAAVDACRHALAGEAYDEKILRDVFSRSGFTDGYLAGRLDGTMFGMRTGEDAAAARAATPQLRELFRRERPCVAVCMAAQLEADGAKLTVTDEDGNRAIVYSGEDAVPQPAQKDQTENIQKALAKTGGTPFYAAQPAQVNDGGWFLPASEWNEMRRKALEGLLAKRETAAGHPCLAVDAPQVQALLLAARREAAAATAAVSAPSAAAASREKRLFVQFAALAQMPETWLRGEREGGSTAEAAQMLSPQPEPSPQPQQPLPEGIIVPLAQWKQVPQTLRPRVWLALPRWMAGVGAEDAVRQQMRESACAAGAALGGVADGAQSDAPAALAFAGYFVQNLAHLEICKGLPMFGGFGLNITNGLAAQGYAALGLCGMTLSPELLAADMARIDMGPGACADRQPAQADARAERLSPPSIAHSRAERLSPPSIAHSRAERLPPPLSAAIVYAHLPLMLTRACPLQNVRASCRDCPGEGMLLDRKGKFFPLHCTAPAGAGVRTIYNPIPIYMGDKLRELPVDIALVQFTVESKAQAAQVLSCVQARAPFPGEFTRGLYFKGTQEAGR